MTLRAPSGARNPANWPFSHASTCAVYKHLNEFEIADLGCGYGRDALHLAKTLGCSVTGIDSSPKAISLAYESCPPELSNRVQFHVR